MNEDKLVERFKYELERLQFGSLASGVAVIGLRRAVSHLRLERHGGAYSGEPCPNCGRIRMLKLGVCDKCYWDLTTATYATAARQCQADTGKALMPLECSFVGGPLNGARVTVPGDALLYHVDTKVGNTIHEDVYSRSPGSERFVYVGQKARRVGG